MNMVLYNRIIYKERIKIEADLSDKKTQGEITNPPSRTTQSIYKKAGITFPESQYHAKNAEFRRTEMIK